jgi:hypothetical protein
MACNDLKTQNGPPTEGEPLCVLKIARRRFGYKNTPRGVEQASDFPGNRTFSKSRNAESDAPIENALPDAGLQAVIDAWPSLPDAIRKAILGLVRSQT